MGNSPHYLGCRRCIMARNANPFAPDPYFRGAPFTATGRTRKTRPGIGHRRALTTRELTCCAGHTFWTSHTAAARITPAPSPARLSTEGTGQ